MPAGEAEKLREGVDKLKEAGPMLSVLGIGFLALFGLGIAAGVVLFMEKAAVFAMIVGVLQVLADGGSLAFVGLTPYNISGILVGALVVVAAVSYKNKPAAARADSCRAHRLRRPSRLRSPSISTTPRPGDSGRGVSRWRRQTRLPRAGAAWRPACVGRSQALNSKAPPLGFS